MPDWDALSTTSTIKRVRVAAVPRHEAEAPCALVRICMCWATLECSPGSGDG